MSRQRATLGATGVFAVPKANPTDKPATNRPDREGRAPLPFWATTAAKKQLRFLAAEHDTNQQALMTEALNLLFHKYGKPEIA
jgi:antitoxin-like ribbon-helix-helix protein